MASRLLRDDFLFSEAYWWLSDKAKVFLWHLMMSADDLGCVELTQIVVGRRCFKRPPSPSTLNRLIAELTAAGWIADEGDSRLSQYGDSVCIPAQRDRGFRRMMTAVSDDVDRGFRRMLTAFAGMSESAVKGVGLPVKMPGNRAPDRAGE